MSTKNSRHADQFLSSENFNSLLLDVYLLPINPLVAGPPFFTEPEILLELANLAVKLNKYIQQYSINNIGRDNCSSIYRTQESSCYRWISGGDGPVFGIHCSPSSSLDPSHNHNDHKKKPGTYMIPHLRTICRYGVCVNDEWCLIGLVLEFLESARLPTQYGVAIECWDIDDGQLVLIEGANFIPQWIDDIGPNHCSHRCWICSSNIHSTASISNTKEWTLSLLRPNDAHQPEPLHLGDAVLLLANHQFEDARSIIEVAPNDMTEAILERIRRGKAEMLQCHRAAVVLPEPVVQLFHHRPDLIAMACQKFVEHIQDPIRVQKIDDYLYGACENWIWTTISYGRTSYAMIRTAISPPEWIYEDSIAPPILATSSLEVKRYQRQCAVEATPHLRYGLQLGVRMLAGLHHCVSAHGSTKSIVATDSSMHDKMSTIERRVLHHWSQVARLCDTDDASNPGANDWITRAWYSGPNETNYDITPILQCPVFIPEIQSSTTPLTSPDVDIGLQIRKELLRLQKNVQLTSNTPHHTQVDNEDWMWTLPTSNDTLFANDAQTPSKPQDSLSTALKSPPQQNEVSSLDAMLFGIKSFMDGTSTVNGVETSNTSSDDDSLPIVINPTVFLNILHAALKSNSAQELSDQLEEMQKAKADNFNDPFFSDEDYRLMDPSSDHESNDDNTDSDTDAMNMNDIMNAMDAELRDGASTSRAWDSVDNNVTLDDDITRNAHVLSNLLQSIDAGGGGSGPMRNILLEMGGSVPSTLDADIGSDQEGDE